MTERAEQVGQQAGEAETDEHKRDRELLGGVGVAAGGCEQPGPDDAQDDRRDRQVLVFAGVLAEHPLCHQHQHEQPGRERRLYDDERSEQQRDHLQRPAEDREAGPEQPAGPPDQAPDEGQTQVLVVGRLLGIHRLERDP